MSEERRASMAAYGAELLSVPAGKMEIARDLAKEMAARGEGIVLDQFGNLDNPLAHYRGTGGAWKYDIFRNLEVSSEGCLFIAWINVRVHGWGLGSRV